MTVITYRRNGTERCVPTTTTTDGVRTIHDINGEDKRIVEVFDEVVEQITHDGYATKERPVQLVRKEP